MFRMSSSRRNRFSCKLRIVSLACRCPNAHENSTDTELLYQLTDSGAKVIFIQPELVPTLEKALAIAPPDYKIDPERIILMCEYDAKPANIPYRCMTELWRKQAVPKQLSGDHEKDTAYLCYSSGTTGKAKGVMTSHHNMTSEIQALNVIYEPLSHEKKDVILGILPFGHIYGLTTLIHQPMTRSVPVVVLPRFEETAVLKAIQDVSTHFAQWWWPSLNESSTKSHLRWSSLPFSLPYSIPPISTITTYHPSAVSCPVQPLVQPISSLPSKLAFPVSKHRAVMVSLQK